MKNFMIILLAVITTTAYSQNCSSQFKNGEGTFYGGVAGSSGGNCSLPVASGDFKHCALNNIDYDGSKACGACIKVTGPKGSVKLKVVDRCPECKNGDVDMTRQAFGQIANISAGRVDIKWKFVPCPLGNKKIKVKFKEGSSRYWTAIQLRDHKFPVKKLEYKKNGNWVKMSRQLYNYFLEPSGIESPMKLRATSIHGVKRTFSNVPIRVNQVRNTEKQFNCPSGNKIETESGMVLKAYPNPMGTNNHLFIDVELPENNDIEVAVFDIQGKLISTQMYNGLDVNGNTIILDANTAFNDQKGVYIVRVTSGAYHKAIKVIR